MDGAAPPEFTEEYVKEHSPIDEQMFAELLLSGEPYKSLAQHHVHLGAKYGYSNNPFNKDGTLRGNPESPGLDLCDDSLYYNTMGSAAEYWADYDLPRPTKDIRQLRADLADWGYCLVEDGLSPEQLAKMQKRTQDQLDGERLAGVASWAGQLNSSESGQDYPLNQYIHGILNKDPEGQFAQCMCHDPRGAQAANLVEQLVTETLGEGFIGSSFLGVVAYKNSQPQGLHQDQGVLHCGGVQSAPWSMNTMYVLDDFTAENGGTLVVPSSHKLISQVGAGNPVPSPFPPAINLQCSAGTIVMFEGRLLHGTGVNTTDKPRRMYVANSLKANFRQQEMWAMSLAPDVLSHASPKLLYRIGLRPTGLGGPEGDWSPDPTTGLRSWRQAADQREYVRVGVLSPESTEEELCQDFTWRHTPKGLRLGAQQPEAIEAITIKYAHLFAAGPLSASPQETPQDVLRPIAPPSNQLLPEEFTLEFIHANSGPGQGIYDELLLSGQPYRSLYKTGFHSSAKFGFVHRPKNRQGSNAGLDCDGHLLPDGLDYDDDELYYNTQGAAAEYWRGVDLPQPTTDIKQMRYDIKRWGYCMIKDALSPEQLEKMQTRTQDQLDGERLAGIAEWQGRPLGNQNLHGILNKDTPCGIFRKAFVQDPGGVQAGPVIEQLITEAIGEGFIGSSFLGIIAYKDCPPQGLHQDQGMMHMGGVQNAPWSMNTMYVLDDFTAENGGTLVVPGSHNLISEVGAGNPVGPLPPAINAECPAGTVVMFEGRLLHGTGVNKTDKPRRMYVGNSLKPSFRQQELWALSLKPEVMAELTPKMAFRMGLHPVGLGGVEGDWASDLRYWRDALEDGTYERIRALSSESTEDDLTRNYTWRNSPAGRGKLGQHQPEAIDAVRARYMKASKL